MNYLKEVKIIDDHDQNNKLRKEFDQIKKDLERAQNENKVLKRYAQTYA